MSPKKQKDDEVEFTPEDLREWQIDKRGARYWQELQEMANKRVNAVTTALDKLETERAIALNGELNGIREAMQLIDIIVDEEKDLEGEPK